MLQQFLSHNLLQIVETDKLRAINQRHEIIFSCILALVQVEERIQSEHDFYHQDFKSGSSEAKIQFGNAEECDQCFFK